MFKWPAKEEVEMVKAIFLFHGPIDTLSFDPFIIKSLELIRQLYNNIKKHGNDIFPDK